MIPKWTNKLNDYQKRIYLQIILIGNCASGLDYLFGFHYAHQKCLEVTLTCSDQTLAGSLWRKELFPTNIAIILFFYLFPQTEVISQHMEKQRLTPYSF